MLLLVLVAHLFLCHFATFFAIAGVLQTGGSDGIWRFSISADKAC
jgi:hypothetical protein